MIDRGSSADRTIRAGIINRDASSARKTFFSRASASPRLARAAGNFISRRLISPRREEATTVYIVPRRIPLRFSMQRGSSETGFLPSPPPLRLREKHRRAKKRRARAVRATRARPIYPLDRRPFSYLSRRRFMRCRNSAVPLPPPLSRLSEDFD